MRYRRLDENGDYCFGNNSLDYIDGNEAIAQAIKTKVMLFYQEWWENISIGIPMFQSIVGKVANQNLNMTATLLLTDRIKEVEGVVSVGNISIEKDNRSISFEIEVETIFGNTNVSLGVGL